MYDCLIKYTNCIEKSVRMKVIEKGRETRLDWKRVAIYKKKERTKRKKLFILCII